MSLPTALLAAALAWLAVPLAAQCTTEWSSGGPQPQLSGWGACSTLWDPDGAGPAVTRLVVGGEYLKGGSAGVDGTVMTWDGSQWESLGSGPGTSPVGTAVVQALTVWNGLLVAGGNFTGGGMDHIALWDGAAWQGLGSGFPIGVQQLTTWNNLLVATSQTGGVPMIRTWNGVTWTSLPQPPNLMFPHATITYQGLLCVAGAENTPTQGVLERWNGTTWLPTIFAQTSIECLAVWPSLAVGGTDKLYAGGLFQTIGGAACANLAVTSGGTAFAWSSVVTGGLPARCDHLHVRRSGLTTAAIVAVVNSTTTPVLQLSGGSFVAMGNAPLASVAYYNSAYHGTTFDTATDDNSLLRYDGTQWAPVVGAGLVGEVRALCPSGPDMIVGGAFTTISGTAMNHVARWDGSTFTPLGSGLVGGSVEALLGLPNGDIVAGGQFLGAGFGSPCIARWDGTAWSGFGPGINGPVRALCRLPNGDLIAGGGFTTAGGLPCANVARWDGTAWSPLGLGTNGDVMALAVRSDGSLFAGGAFTTAGGAVCNRVAQWNGTAWLPVGAGTNDTVQAFTLRPNGDLIAVGAFTSAGGLPAARCARWNGVSWTNMGAVSATNRPVYAVCTLPNGDVVGGRSFGQAAAASGDDLARWNGASWSDLGGDLEHYFTSYPVAIRALAPRADGALIVGGTFSTAGGQMSKSLAVLASTCPATSTPYGTGCSSAAGPLVLTADTLPWIGSTFRTTTTGIAPLTVCLGLIGLSQTSIPLGALLAEGQPGCDLLVSLDILLTPEPGAGTVSTTFALANDPSLIGVPFYQQTFPFELDLNGAIVAVRASNALSLVIGRL
ncbi:MAG: hypothetical protein JNL08_12960 [Planctomycetes bacterium]|nr:hypothetical protein [Planctomycetota bacterium]